MFLFSIHIWRSFLWLFIWPFAIIRQCPNRYRQERRGERERGLGRYGHMACIPTTPVGHSWLFLYLTLKASVFCVFWPASRVRLCCAALFFYCFVWVSATLKLIKIWPFFQWTLLCFLHLSSTAAPFHAYKLINFVVLNQDLQHLDQVACEK